MSYTILTINILFNTDIHVNDADLEFDGQDEFVEGIMLPNCNKNATSVSEVYNVHGIIPEEVLKSLNSAVDTVIQNDPK